MKASVEASVKTFVKANFVKLERFRGKVPRKLPRKLPRSVRG